MDEIVLLLYMLKLFRKARNVGVLFRYLRVRENFISLITFIATAEIYKKTKILNTVNIYTKNEAAHQGASDLVFEMQTTDHEKFFNYFRMTSELF